MTDKKLTKLYHPTIRNSEVEVAASEVSRWSDQGWRKTAPDLSDGVAPAAPAVKKAAAPSRAARKRAAAKKTTTKKAAAKKAVAAPAASDLHPGAG